MKGFLGRNPAPAILVASFVLSMGLLVVTRTTNDPFAVSFLFFASFAVGAIGATGALAVYVLSDPQHFVSKIGNLASGVSAAFGSSGTGSSRRRARRGNHRRNRQYNGDRMN